MSQRAPHTSLLALAYILCIMQSWNHTSHCWHWRIYCVSCNLGTTHLTVGTGIYTCVSCDLGTTPPTVGIGTLCIMQSWNTALCFLLWPLQYLVSTATRQQDSTQQTQNHNISFNIYRSKTACLHKALPVFVHTTVYEHVCLSSHKLCSYSSVTCTGIDWQCMWDRDRCVVPGMRAG